MMDTKNIEDLIARYWESKTSVAEEKELRSFFASDGELPVDLEKWRDWFAAEVATVKSTVSTEELDCAVLEYASTSVRKVKRLRLLRICITTVAAAAIALAVYIPASRTTPQQILTPTDMESYETAKELLNFAAKKLDRAGIILEEGIEKLNVMNEYIHIK